MKTPMQELIEVLKSTTLKSDEIYTIFYAIDVAESMLEKEKEVIMNAYVMGDSSDCLTEQNPFLFAEDYYDKTFKSDEE